ncbi:hypothetical protein GCM10027038_17640 [Arthrobacter bambusae]
MFGIATVPVPTREDGGEAKVLVAAAAKPAAPAGSTQPCHSDPVTAPEPHAPFARLADYSYCLVPGDYIRRPRGEIALCQMQIRAADTAGPHSDQELTHSWLRIGAFAPNKWPGFNRSWFPDPPRTHDCSLLWVQASPPIWILSPFPRARHGPPIPQEATGSDHGLRE